MAICCIRSLLCAMQYAVIVSPMRTLGDVVEAEDPGRCGGGRIC